MCKSLSFAGVWLFPGCGAFTRNPQLTGCVQSFLWFRGLIFFFWGQKVCKYFSDSGTNVGCPTVRRPILTVICLLFYGGGTSFNFTQKGFGCFSVIVIFYVDLKYFFAEMVWRCFAPVTRYLIINDFLQNLYHTISNYKTKKH